MKRLWAALAGLALVPCAVAARADARHPAARPAAPRATAQCTVSRAAFTKLPFPTSPHARGDLYDFAQFTATRGGLWAGSIYQAFTGQLYLISWRSGHPVRILARYAYPGSIYSPIGSVHPVGITPHDDIVAQIQTEPPLRGRARTRGLFWSSTGKRHVMSHARKWVSWYPVSVSDSGRIFGEGAYRSGNRIEYVVVSWAHVGAHYRVLADVGRQDPDVTADGAGDVVWFRPEHRTVVHLASGATTQLVDPLTGAGVGPGLAGDVATTGASRHAIFGATDHGIVEWNLSTRPGSTVTGTAITHTEGSRTSVDTVGPGGDAVLDIEPTFFRTSTGARASMPKQYFFGGAAMSPTRAIASDGTVAFTAHDDRRIHFLRCR